MPLLKILSSSEITGFDSPPVFNHEERKKFFNLPSGLKSEWETLRTTENKILFLLQLGYFRAQQRFFAGHFHSADFEYISTKFNLSFGTGESLSYLLDKADLQSVSEPAAVISKLAEQVDRSFRQTSQNEKTN